jgi:multidrug transporter EmrE-like cation transporter
LTNVSPQHHRRSVFFVFCCTLIGAAAQVLIKTGAVTLGDHPSLVKTAIGILTTLPLFVGYSMYGISMVLLVLALRHGELSALYPVFALTFVWVTILSVTVFHETLNVSKLAGIVLIVGGVATLGRGSNRGSKE